MPAVWTTSPLWTDELPLSVPRLNQLIGQDGNLDYLYRLPTRVLRLGGSDYISSSTSFVNVDGTNLVLTITPKNGRVTCIAIGHWKIVTGGVPTYIDWIVDDTTRHGDASRGTFAQQWLPADDNNKLHHPFFCLAHFTGLTNAAHTFKLQWRCDSSGGGTVHMLNTINPIMLLGGQD